MRQRGAGLLFQPPESIEAGQATPDELANWFSHPTWMVDRWLGQHGYAGTVALLQHNNRCTDVLQTQCALPSLLTRASCKTATAMLTCGMLHSPDALCTEYG